MIVNGEGPVPCEVMLVGEAPGAEEERTGHPFVGKSGMELDRYLHHEGMRRKDCYVTNLVKERPPGNRDPNAEEIAYWEGKLFEEVERVKPRIVGSLGRFSTHWFLRDDPDMEDCVGVPMWAGRTWTYGTPMVLPITHPAAGLHNPDVMLQTMYGFERLGEALRGKIQPLPAGKKTVLWADHFDLLPAPVIAVDTEGTVKNPWGLSVSSRPGEAVVIRAGDEEGLWKFQNYLDFTQPLVVMHYGLHDIPVLRAMGIDITRYELGDTMVMAYLLGVEPQALKSLAFRHLRIKVPSYKDIVRDAESKIATDYISTVWETGVCRKCLGKGKIRVKGKNGKWKKTPDTCAMCDGDGSGWPKPEETLEIVHGILKFSKPQGLGRRLRAWQKEEQQGKTVDYRRRWEALPGDIREVVEGTLGPMREATLDDVPREVAYPYSALDADMTLRIYGGLIPSISDRRMDTLLKIDTGIIPCVERMMAVGMKIDREHFKTFSCEIQEEMQKVSWRLRSVVGHPINPNSPVQVARLLFVEFGFEAPVQTKTGMDSTDDSVISVLLQKVEVGSLQHEAMALILRYRELQKLDGTYLTPLPLMADKEDRVHTTFKTTRASTGRLTSSNPNLQNIPARTEEGMRIRAGFIPGEGRVLYSADYSQVEMRVMAHVSQDEAMINAIIGGLDLHIYTAALIFHWPGGYEAMYTAYKGGDKNAKRLRSAAKSVGFGIIYRISALGIMRQMEELGDPVSEEEAERWIKMYLHEVFPGMGRWMLENDRFLREHGYVVDMFGRRRYLPGIYSKIRGLAEEALRQGGNMPIQSGAQNILKLAMIRIYRRTLPDLRAKGWVEMISQVHDELIFEADEALAEELDKRVRYEMENVVRLAVPLVAEGKIGMRWSELK